MEVFYNNKFVNNNEFLKPSETQTEPKIKYDFNSNNLYTLILYDPDAVNGTHVHWIATNIKNNINNSKALLPYQGPAPPVKTGKHRYMFELYKQSEMLNVEPLGERSISINSLRNKLNLSKYISKIQFISQNESGGKHKKTKKRKINNKKTKRNRKA
jgi:phosphatidylethanolamine-binding protein (PEBP) family uncharacterized protein